MLSVNQLSGFGARRAEGGGPSGELIGSFTPSPTNGTTLNYTFDFGAGGANSKWVMILAQGNFSGSMSTGASVNVDEAGDNFVFTNIAGASVGVGANERVEAWYYDDAAGDISGSLDTTIDWNSNIAQKMILFRLTNMASGGPANADTDNTSGTVASMTNTIAANGILLQGYVNRHNSDPTVTFTANDDTVTNGPTTISGGGIRQYATLQTSLSNTITLSADGGFRNVGGCAMAFDPA